MAACSLFNRMLLLTDLIPVHLLYCGQTVMTGCNHTSFEWTRAVRHIYGIIRHMQGLYSQWGWSWVNVVCCLRLQWSFTGCGFAVSNLCEQLLQGLNLPWLFLIIGSAKSPILINSILLYTFAAIDVSAIKGCRMGRSDKVSLWYVALLINTRFRFFILEYAIVKRI